uniref:Transglutaminase N-terminal domain-containing protein n=1 Tax=Periophthalmus magnuspinnatus TaxID=409849 RepID=A0A3B3ZL82_9GOBI
MHNLAGVFWIDSCDLNLTSNKVNHHTEHFPEEHLIVRRGQPFSVTLCLKSGGAKFKPGKSIFTITVQTGTFCSYINQYRALNSQSHKT